MSFIERIKQNLNDERNRRGMRDKVLVDARALDELVRHYDVLDSAERALHPEARRQQIFKQLHDTLAAAYHQQSCDSELTLMVVMETLLPLIEQKQRDRITRRR
jgi:hypothetical protein